MHVITRVLPDEGRLLLPSIICQPFGYTVPKDERFQIAVLPGDVNTLRISKKSLVTVLPIQKLSQFIIDDTYTRNRYLEARGLVAQYFRGELDEIPDDLIGRIECISSIPSNASFLFYWLATRGLPLGLERFEYSRIIAEGENILRIRLWNKFTQQYQTPPAMIGKSLLGCLRRLSTASREVYRGRTRMYADIIGQQPAIRVLDGKFWEYRLEV